MKIIEVRDGFIKFETSKRISVSSFVLIKGSDKQYIAQVIQLKHGGSNFVVYAKILYLYNGGILAYDKTLPELNAEVEPFALDLILGTTNNTNSVMIGKMIGEKTDILADSSAFDKKTLVSINSNNIKNIFIENLIKQLSSASNVVVIDMQGNINGKRHVPGVDFKLPLNYDSLAFMYEDCLNDATSDSKTLIGSIFKDLAEYSKTVDFLPFEALKNIIDDMVNTSHVFKLLVLKNKLAKFSQYGYFANNKQEAENLENILKSNVSVIDLSKLDLIFQNRYLKVIYSILEKMDINIKIFVNISNYIDKQNLKRMVLGECNTTIIANSQFRYLKDLKSMYSNYIVESDFSNNEIFKLYQTFLNSMQKESLLIVGDHTNYIPLIATEEVLSIKKLSDIDERSLEPTDENTIAINKQTNECIEKIATEIEDNPREENVSLFIDDSSGEDEIINELETEQTKDNAEITVEKVDKTEENEIFQQDNIEESDETELEVQNISIEKNEEDENNVESEIENNSEIDTEDNDNKNSEDICDNTQISDTFDDFHTQSYSTESIKMDDDISELIEAEDVNVDDKDIESDNSESLSEQNIVEESKDELLLTENSETIIMDDEVSELMEIDTEEDDIDNKNFETESENNILEEQNEDLASKEFTEIHPEISEDVQVHDEPIKIEELAQESEQEKKEQIIAQESSDIELQSELTDIPDEELLLNSEDEIVDVIDDDVLIDITEPELDAVDVSLDDEINNDVDALYTTMKEDTISEDDLDLIDELNESNSDEEIEDIKTDTSLEELPDLTEYDSDDELLEPIEELQPQQQEPETSDNEILETKTASTPTVPVYSADIPSEDKVMSDAIEQGDSVMHAKYGVGIVEKMIKYGAKTLYSINFDNVGRRLLDPTLTELKKV